jgi:hypothetical protein
VKKPSGKNGKNGAGVRRGPEPERLKITHYLRWEDAVTVAMRKKKPAKGWPKK